MSNDLVASNQKLPLEDWVSVDRESYTSLWQFGLKHSLAVSVLNFMVSKMAKNVEGVVISVPAMARMMGISERSAKSAVAALKTAKFVQILKSGNTNVYIINSRVVWEGKRGARFATFNTQLLVDEQEQKMPVDQLEQESLDLIDVPNMEILL